MKTGKKLLTGTLLALCAALLVFCIVLAIRLSKTAKTNAAALPEVRNSGTAIQWRYSAEEEWRDLVALTELTGAAGENGRDGENGENGIDGKNGINGTNGKDGKNGVDGKDGADGKNGKDGINAKNIEVQRAETYIQWRYEGDEWQNLVAIADITGPAGQNGADGANGKTPEFRVSENTLQWRYIGDEIWLNLYDLSVLKGLDGKDGADGKDGVDGEKGDKGDKGDPGEKGDKGDKGDPGQNGGSSGYFYAEANSPSAVLNNSRVNITVYEKINKGGLISSYRNNITLKKGHIYSVSISGSLEVGSNESNKSGNYSIQMTDGYDDNLCRELTRIKRDGAKIPYTNDQHSFNFSRMYDASNKDITLQLRFENSAYNTYLNGFSGTITIITLD
mgnify:CR=1 FL=1